MTNHKLSATTVRNYSPRVSGTWNLATPALLTTLHYDTIQYGMDSDVEGNVVRLHPACSSFQYSVCISCLTLSSRPCSFSILCACLVSLSRSTCPSVKYRKIFLLFFTFYMGCWVQWYLCRQNKPYVYGIWDKRQVESSSVVITRFKPRGHLSPTFPSFYSTKKHPLTASCRQALFCLPVGVEFLFWTVWRESLSPWQRLVMNKIKGNLALVPQHLVILASRGHGGEAVRILYLETRGRGVLSFIHWQFCGRRKSTKISKCRVVWVNYIAGLDAAKKKKTLLFIPRQYSQVTFVVRTAIHIFHQLHDFSEGLQASYVISS